MNRSQIACLCGVVAGALGASCARAETSGGGGGGNP